MLSTLWMGIFLSSRMAKKTLISISRLKLNHAFRKNAYIQPNIFLKLDFYIDLQFKTQLLKV